MILDILQTNKADLLSSSKNSDNSILSVDRNQRLCLRAPCYSSSRYSKTNYIVPFLTRFRILRDRKASWTGGGEELRCVRVSLMSQNPWDIAKRVKKQGLPL